MKRSRSDQWLIDTVAAEMTRRALANRGRTRWRLAGLVAVVAAGLTALWVVF